MHSRLILFGVFSLYLHAQQDPKDLILAVQEKINATTERLPRYMCTQTIDRQQYEPDRPVPVHTCEAISDRKTSRAGASHLATSDRLRIDVTVAAKSEIFSWVGENHFTDRSLWEFVTDGIISTGNFSAALTMIFAGDSAEFSYIGEVLAAGRTLAEFGYQVPLEQSHYKFGDRRRWWTTAYEGTLQIDPKTKELVRLVLRTVNLPSETGECQLETTMQYGAVHINNQDFLLPSETVLKTTDFGGIEKINRSVYSGCHEFLGESKISFDSPLDEPASSRPAPAPSASLAPGTRFSLELAQDIDTLVAAAGDPVKARLATAISSQGIEIPKGTLVDGRLLAVRRYYRAESLLLTIRFDAFELAGVQIPFHADWIPVPNPKPSSSSLRPGAIPLGTLQSMSQHGIVNYRYPSARQAFVLKRGFKSEWSAIAP
jgi:hypothetical protein